MMHLKHYEPTNGYTSLFTPGEGELKHLTFGILSLSPNQTYRFTPESNREAALTVLIGSVDAASDGQRWEGLGGRTTVFDGATDTLFVPAGNSLELHAVSDCEIAISQAVSDYNGVVRLFAASEAIVEQRGKPGWEREVRTYIAGNADVGRLILGESAAGLGQWSSFPPHKHDQDNLPHEADLEEIYFYKIEPDTGFAFQGLYSPDVAGSEHLAYIVRHNDIVTIPYGYHPVAPAPDHRTCYYWVLAGKGHDLKVHFEQTMRWMEQSGQPPTASGNTR